MKQLDNKMMTEITSELKTARDHMTPPPPLRLSNVVNVFRIGVAVASKKARCSERTDERRCLCRLL